METQGINQSWNPDSKDDAIDRLATGAEPRSVNTPELDRKRVATTGSTFYLSSRDDGTSWSR